MSAAVVLGKVRFFTAIACDTPRAQLMTAFYCFFESERDAIAKFADKYPQTVEVLVAAENEDRCRWIKPEEVSTYMAHVDIFLHRHGLNAYIRSNPARTYEDYLWGELSDRMPGSTRLNTIA